MEMTILKLSMVVNNYNPGIWEAKAGRLLAVGQPELHSKTLPKNMVIFSKQTYKFNTILMKIPAALERTQNSYNNLWKEKLNFSIHTSNFENLLHSKIN